MADEDRTTAGRGTAPGKRRSRGLRALWRRWRRGAHAPERHASRARPRPTPPVDIVDQAEAFKTLRVDDVMTPRADIVAVEIASPFADGRGAASSRAEHSRMPIYRETLDDPVGLVHIKDVFKLLADEAPPAGRRTSRCCAGCAARCCMCPASMRAADLLVRMQAQPHPHGPGDRRVRRHRRPGHPGGRDRGGGRRDRRRIRRGRARPRSSPAPAGCSRPTPARRWRTWRRRSGRALAPPDLEEEIDTIAGLVAALAGRVPQRGEVIAHPDGFDFEITDADPRRVKRVRIRKLEPPDAAPPEGDGRHRRVRRIEMSAAARLLDRRGARAVAALVAGRRRRPGPPPFGVLPGLLGYGVLMSLFDAADPARPLRSAFWRGWLAGAAFFLISTWWVAEAFFVDAAKQGWMAPFAIGFLAGGLGLFWGLAGVALSRADAARAGARAGLRRRLLPARMAARPCADRLSLGPGRARAGGRARRCRRPPPWSAPMG